MFCGIIFLMKEEKTLELREVKTASIVLAWVLPLLMFFGGLAVSLYSWQVLNTSLIEQEEQQLDLVSTRIRILLSEQLEIYEELLKVARSLFAASDSVDRDEWAAFFRSQDLATVGDIKAIEYVTKVNAEDLDEFIEQVRNDTSIDPAGYPDFDVNPKEGLEILYVVNYIEPFEGNEGVFGFNTGGETTRLQTLETARDTNSIVATKSVNLVQGPDQKNAYIIYIPIYENNQPIETVFERRQNFKGLAVLVVLAENMFLNLEDNLTDIPNVGYKVLEEENDLTKLVYQRNIKTEGNGRILTKDIEVEFAGQIFTVEVERQQITQGLLSDQNLGNVVLGGSLALTTLLSIVVFVVLRSRYRVTLYANKVTAKLRSSNEVLAAQVKKTSEAEKKLSAHNKELMEAQAELEKSLQSLEKLNSVMTGRELKMVQLKKELKKLKGTDETEE